MDYLDINIFKRGFSPTPETLRIFHDLAARVNFPSYVNGSSKTAFRLLVERVPR
ncbi:hypothetical protein HDU97_009609, partial [Phlyctochytrium planicorne]